MPFLRPANETSPTRRISSHRSSRLGFSRPPESMKIAVLMMGLPATWDLTDRPLSDRDEPDTLCLRQKMACVKKIGSVLKVRCWEEE